MVGSLVERKIQIRVDLREDALKTTPELIPAALSLNDGLHQNNHTVQVFLKSRVADIMCQPLMVTRLACSAISLWVQLLKFVSHTWR